MNKKIGLLILSFALVLPLAAGAATSTKSTTTPGAINKAVKGAIARCAIIESKIQVKVTAFDNTKIKHLTVYDNLKSRLNSLADRLASRGVDVTALRATFVVLDQKIAKFSADYAIYVAKLKASQDFVCGRSETNFKTQLKETKAALLQVHKDAADIRAYYNTTIKAEINKIKNSLKANASTTPETVSSTKAVMPKKTAPVKPIVPALPNLD